MIPELQIHGFTANEQLSNRAEDLARGTTCYALIDEGHRRGSHPGNFNNTSYRSVRATTTLAGKGVGSDINTNPTIYITLCQLWDRPIAVAYTAYRFASRNMIGTIVDDSTLVRSRRIENATHRSVPRVV